MENNLADTALETEITYCAVHPERDTGLRCNRCDRYMCVQCAVRTPVGYTCRECVRGHEDRFYQSTLLDYALVAAASAAGGGATAMATILLGGFLIIGFLIAPAIGGATAQLALMLTGRRRGRHSGIVCASALLIGGIAASIVVFGAINLFALLYLALAASAAFARFKVSI